MSRKHLPRAPLYHSHVYDYYGTEIQAGDILLASEGRFSVFGDNNQLFFRGQQLTQALVDSQCMVIEGSLAALIESEAAPE